MNHHRSTGDLAATYGAVFPTGVTLLAGVAFTSGAASTFPFPVGGTLAAGVSAAQRDLDAGRPDRAAATLHRHLARIDPDTAAADPVLTDAAYLYAESARDDGDSRLRWAAYAFDASSCLHDAYHPRTLAAARILVELAQRLDVPGRGAVPEPRYQDKISRGTSILRAYLTRLIHSGRTADVHALTTITAEAASR